MHRSLQRPVYFFARHRGEEFVVILSGTPGDGALKVAETILENIRKLKIQHDNSSDRTITLSISIATQNFARHNPYEVLVRHADIVLYTSKQNGKNRAELFTDQNDI